MSNVHASTYTVYPTGVDPDTLDGMSEAHSFSITVQWRGPHKWAVLRNREALGTDGCWDYESLPSGREDHWLATHRFSLDEALRLAQAHVDHNPVNGLTWHQWEHFRTLDSDEERAAYRAEVGPANGAYWRKTHYPN